MEELAEMRIRSSKDNFIAPKDMETEELYNTFGLQSGIVRAMLEMIQEQIAQTDVEYQFFPLIGDCLSHLEVTNTLCAELFKRTEGN